MLINRIVGVVRHPEKLLLAINREYNVLKFLDDKRYLEFMFRLKMGTKLDLANPHTFNEKLQWLKLFDHKSEYVTMVDKYAVKNYVADIIGEEYIIPTLGVWRHFDDIDFNQLPNQFVLKCTHDSGGLVIVNDKSGLDKRKARKKIEKSLKTDYYMVGREWPYKNVPRQIIAEKYMTDDSEMGLRDYKVLCFNGSPKLVEIHNGRFSGTHTQDFYDTNWNKTDFVQPEDPMSGMVMGKPAFIDEMFKLSAKLAEGIPHVRVDWYFSNNRLFFGELTFFDGSGFFPFKDGQDKIIGNWLTLPQKKL